MSMEKIMVEKMRKTVRGSFSVQLVIRAGFGALAFAALIYAATTPHYAMAGAYGDYITQEGDTLVVSPFDWSSLGDATYDWYDMEDIYAYINEGVLLDGKATARLVVNADGTPNLPENIPVWYWEGEEKIDWFTSQFYFNDNGDRDLAFNRLEELFLWADLKILTVVGSEEPIELLPDTMADDLEALGNHYYYELCNAYDDDGNLVVDDDGNPVVIVCDEERDYGDPIETHYLREMPEDLAAIEGFPALYGRFIEMQGELKKRVRDNFLHDSDNIQVALDAANADNGIDTVRLAPGTFYLGRTVVAEGYHGSLTGSGRDATFVETVPGGFLWYKDPWIGEMDAQGKIDCTTYLPPAPIYVLGGDARIADLFMDLEGGLFGSSIHGQAMSYWMAPVVASGICNGLPTDEIQSVSLTTDNVVIVAEPNEDDIVPDFYYHSFTAAPYVLGEPKEPMATHPDSKFWVGDREEDLAKRVTGDFRFTNSEFIGGIVAIWFGPLKDSSVVVGGNREDGNTFRWSVHSVTMGHCDNCAIEISYNDMEMAGGAGMVQEPYGNELASMTSFVVENNEIDMAEWNVPNAISVTDLTNAFVPGTTGVLASVSENKINLVGPWQVGVLSEFASDGIMLDNQVTGTGATGFLMGMGWEGEEGEEGLEDHSGGWTLVGNNLETFEADWGPKVVLGPFFTDSIIIGGSHHVSNDEEVPPPVLDLSGGANGHRITGMTPMSANSVPGIETALGQAVKDARDCREALLSGDRLEFEAACPMSPLPTE